MTALQLHHDDVVDATVDLDPDEARALTARIRGLVTEAVALLQQAYLGRAWVALGYESWVAYLAGELGGALAGLPVDDRDQAILVLRESGVSGRATAAAVGRSEERVRDTVRRLRPEGITAASVGMDGKTYVRSAAAAQAVAAARPMLALPGPRKQDTALDLLELAGPDGLTIVEVQRKKRWTYSQASACLSRLNAALEQHDGGRRRRVERLTERRGGYAVYVLPEYIADRPVLAPGQRLPRSA